MAKHIGSASEYLYRQERFYRLLGLTLAAIITISIGVSLYVGYYRLIAYQYGILLVSALAVNILNKFAVKKVKYDKGIEGENDVYDSLMKLSDEFHVLEDVILPGRKGNIDFVVVGPTGLFAIEVKNHRNVKISSNSDLVNKSREINQALNNALKIGDVLMEKFGNRIFVNPIVVHVDKYAKIRLGEERIKGVSIIRLEWLIKQITERSPNWNQPYVKKIVNVLSPYTNN